MYYILVLYRYVYSSFEWFNPIFVSEQTASSPDHIIIMAGKENDATETTVKTPEAVTSHGVNNRLLHLYYIIMRQKF